MRDEWLWAIYQSFQRVEKRSFSDSRMKAPRFSPKVQVMPALGYCYRVGDTCCLRIPDLSSVKTIWLSLL